MIKIVQKIVSSGKINYVPAFVQKTWPVNSPHKGPVTRKIFPIDDVIIGYK